MNKQKTLIFSLSAILFLALSFIVYSFTEPTTMPSSYNPPINTSTTGQTKKGQLKLEGPLYAPMIYDQNNTNYYIDPSGNSIIAGKITTDYNIQENDAPGTLSTKGFVESFIGETIMGDAPAARLYFVEGTNPSCPSTTFLVGKRCGNGTWSSGSISCTYDAAMCAGQDPANMLYSLKHSVSDCENLPNSSVQTEAGTLRRFCKISGTSSCPSGWTQYKNWSSTKAAPSCSCTCVGGGCCVAATYTATILISGSCGNHAWNNTPVEEATLGTYGTPSWDKCLGPDCCQCKVKATITDIGCY